MMVVNHLPFLKSTAMSPPEAAELLTFHPVSTYDSPRGLSISSMRSIPTCPSGLVVSPTFSMRQSTSLSVYPPKAHLLGAFNPGCAPDPSDPSREGSVTNATDRKRLVETSTTPPERKSGHPQAIRPSAQRATWRRRMRRLVDYSPDCNEQLATGKQNWAPLALSRVHVSLFA